MIHPNAIGTLFAVAALAFLIDIPWLWLNQDRVGKMLRTIQGGIPMRVRLLPAIVVYLAIAYLILEASSARDAFYLGAAAYAIYDFTNYSTLANYNLAFAIGDTAWGGVLFYATRVAAHKLGLV